MILSFISYRRSKLLLIAVGGFCCHLLGLSGAAFGLEACETYHENRLQIGNALKDRRFNLAPSGPMQVMYSSAYAPGRAVLHRTFSLSLDAAENLSLYYGPRPPNCCIVAPDREKTQNLKLPVFFVGRIGEDPARLEERASAARFAPSDALKPGATFVDVAFHLRKSSFYFSQIQPFFRCGLPGVLLCEDDCPGNTAGLASSLVNAVVKAEFQKEQPRTAEAEQKTPASEEPNTRDKAPAAVSTPKAKEDQTPVPLRVEEKPKAEAQPPSPAETQTRPVPPKPAPPVPVTSPKPSVTQHQDQVPVPRPSEEKLKAEPQPASPAETQTNSSPPKLTQPVPVTPPKPPATHPQDQAQVPLPAEEQPKAESQPASPAETQTNSSPPKLTQPVPVTPAKPPATSPERGKQLVLTFEKTDHTPFEAAEVLLAERKLSIEGAPFTLKPMGLVAEMTLEAFGQANKAAIEAIFHHYDIVAVKDTASGYLLTVQPLYVPADKISVEVQDAANEAVRNCALRLEVPVNRQLGLGWDKLRQGQNSSELKFFNDEGPIYRVNLPVDIAENELLISTEDAGSELTLSSATSNCTLDQNTVTLDELKGLTLKRTLERSGPIFIAVVTTDSTFASALSTDTEVFWTNTLGLIRSVSAANWQKKILARAQAPISLETKILDVAAGTKQLEASQEQEAQDVSLLRTGSALRRGPLSILRFKPIERFHLDLVFKTFQEMMNFSPRRTIGKESLLFVSGSVKSGGSDFCSRAVHGDNTEDNRPYWIKQISHAFIIEVWDDSTIDELRKNSHAEAAAGAPAGVFRCKIGGNDGDKINLYGMSLTALKDAGVQKAMFSYLLETARNFLKP